MESFLPGHTVGSRRPYRHSWYAGSNQDGEVDRTHSDKQLSNDVVCKHLLVCEGDFEGTILLGTLAGPVLLTLLLAPLHNIGYHGNYTDPLLPHQPPEVSDGVWEGACESFEILVDMENLQLQCAPLKGITSSPWVAMYFLC